MPGVHTKDAKIYRGALRTLALTQKEAAEILAINERTSRRYALGESRLPLAIKRYLARMVEEKEGKG